MDFSKFGLGQRALKISSLLMDDSHACIDAIRNAFTIRLQQKDETYQRIFQLFAQTLESQGAGTFTDLKNANPNAFLPISLLGVEIEKIRHCRNPRKSFWFRRCEIYMALLKDSLEHCQCMIGGENLEIQPYMPDYRIIRFVFSCKASFLYVSNRNQRFISCSRIAFVSEDHKGVRKPRTIDTRG